METYPKKIHDVIYEHSLKRFAFCWVLLVEKKTTYTSWYSLKNLAAYIKTLKKT